MNTVILKLVCAIVIAGEVVRAGSLVEVTRSEAKDLLSRGKAVPHDHDPESDETVTSSGSAEPTLHPEIAAHQEDRAEQAEEAAQEAAQGAADAAGNSDSTEGASAPQDAAAPPAAGRRSRNRSR